MQLGFVLDQSRCIGCHACTVACKSENDVPLGKFRTWVKYTETGQFPEVRRSFTVLRCNQCTDAPCVTICPVTALDKRADGIVDVDHRVCIGCKACMQGCPYDALHINEETGTAQKCHFCAHRTERGLAPACAVVCPTEAIIPGDFHDPRSRVSRMRAEERLVGRKPEAGTGPNVFYKEAHPSGLSPLETNAAGGFLWANQTPGMRLDAQNFEKLEEKARSRTVYDVEHTPYWGGRVSAYLFTKSLAAGAFLGGLLLLPAVAGEESLSGRALCVLPIVGLLFLLVTTFLLVTDLKRPDRFLLILTRPNWSSWLVKGTVVLMAYGGLLSAWLLLALLRPDALLGTAGTGLALATAVAAALTAAYTAWLFRQSRGRVLWMRRGMALHLVFQASIAGCALYLVAAPVLPAGAVGPLRIGLLTALIGHFLFTIREDRLAPVGREAEYERASQLVTRGPFAARHWILGVGLGVVIPALLVLAVTLGGPGWLLVTAGVLALVGLFVEEDILVRAGQALLIS